VTIFVLPRVGPMGSSKYLSLQLVSRVLLEYLSSVTLIGISLGGGVFSLSGYLCTGIGTIVGAGVGDGFLEGRDGACLEAGLAGAGDADWGLDLLGDKDLVLVLDFSLGLETTDDALDLIKGFPTGSFCLARLAKVLPATPGDLDR